jgi:hypothetical protein
MKFSPLGHSDSKNPAVTPHFGGFPFTIAAWYRDC